jgi:hypothetical protein
MHLIFCEEKYVSMEDANVFSSAHLQVTVWRRQACLMRARTLKSAETSMNTHAKMQLQNLTYISSYLYKQLRLASHLHMHVCLSVHKFHSISVHKYVCAFVDRLTRIHSFEQQCLCIRD